MTEGPDNIETDNQEKKTIAKMALYEVIDPELNLNIIDLGLVYKLKFEGNPREIIVTMTFTTQFCPMGESIKDATIRAMEDVFPQNDIQIDLTFDPPWDQSMISERGLEYLNFG